MKKLFLGFSFLLLSIGTVFATDTGKGFSLDAALGELGLKERPQFLAGVNDDAIFDSKELKGEAVDITRFINKVSKSFAGGAAAIAIIMIVMNAFALVTAMGDSDAIGNAKKGLLWSFLGLLLIVFAYVIIKSIVAMTYSGEFEEKPEEAAKVVERIASTSECVKPDSIPIPPPHYGDDDASDKILKTETQHKKADKKGKFPSILYGYGIGTTGEEVQRYLKAEGCYAGLSGCDKIDGMYGQCTMKALHNYNNKQSLKFNKCQLAEKDQALAETKKKAEKKPEVKS